MYPNYARIVYMYSCVYMPCKIHTFSEHFRMPLETLNKGTALLIRFHCLFNVIQNDINCNSVVIKD